MDKVHLLLKTQGVSEAQYRAWLTAQFYRVKKMTGLVIALVLVLFFLFLAWWEEGMDRLAMFILGVFFSGIAVLTALYSEGESQEWLKLYFLDNMKLKRMKRISPETWEKVRRFQPVPKKVSMRPPFFFSRPWFKALKKVTLLGTAVFFLLVLLIVSVELVEGLRFPIKAGLATAYVLMVYGFLLWAILRFMEAFLNASLTMPGFLGDPLHFFGLGARILSGLALAVLLGLAFAAALPIWFIVQA